MSNTPTARSVKSLSTSACGWIVWSMAATFYFYEFFLAVSPSVLVDVLMKEFSVSAHAIGYFGMIYLIGYAVMQIPVGALLDRFGPRRVLMIASIVCAIGCYILSISTSLMGASFARFFMGLGSAFAVVGCFKVAASWFPVKRFALVAGLTVSVGMTGATMGEGPLAKLIELIGWRSSMLVLAVVGVIVAILLYAIVRDEPSEPIHEKTSKNVKFRPTRLFDGLGTVLANPQSWLNAFYAGCMFAPTLTLTGLWGTPYLMKVYALSTTVAASMISLIFFGWVIGAPLSGWISEHIGRRKPPMIIGSVGTLIFLCLFLYTPNLPLFLLDIIIFALGFFSSGFLPAFSIVKESNPIFANATSLGFMNFINSLGPASGQLLVGRIMDIAAGGLIVAGVHVYSARDYHVALTALPIYIIAALIILPFIKETYCRVVEK